MESLIYFYSQSKTSRGRDVVEFSTWPVGETLGICKCYSAKQTVTAYNKTTIRFER